MDDGVGADGAEDVSARDGLGEVEGPVLFGADVARRIGVERQHRWERRRRGKEAEGGGEERERGEKGGQKRNSFVLASLALPSTQKIIIII